MKYKHDKRYSTLEVSQPTRSTALYPVEQQPYEAIQLGGMAKGRHIVHTTLRDLPFQLVLLQLLKSIGLQPGRSSLFSPSECRVGTETPFHCPENPELSGKADPSDVYMIQCLSHKYQWINLHRKRAHYFRHSKILSIAPRE